MGWSQLGTQFCLQLAFGVLFTLVFVAQVPLGAFFFRMMGTTALVPLLVAIVGACTSRQMGWTSPTLWSAAVAAALFPLYSSPIAARKRRLALIAAAVASALALALHLWSIDALPNDWRALVAIASALATGCVAGGVGLAMVFGHWYLTVPTLDVAHLARLNRITITCMLVSAAALALTCFAFTDVLSSAGTSLYAPRGLFHFGTRIVVGLAMPLLFGWMVTQSLQFKNTRSATGILYASTVLVLIGTAVAVSLQDTYGIPL